MSQDRKSFPHVFSRVDCSAHHPAWSIYLRTRSVVVDDLGYDLELIRADSKLCLNYVDRQVLVIKMMNRVDESCALLLGHLMANVAAKMSLNFYYEGPRFLDPLEELYHRIRHDGPYLPALQVEKGALSCLHEDLSARRYYDQVSLRRIAVVSHANVILRDCLELAALICLIRCDQNNSANEDPLPLCNC